MQAEYINRQRKTRKNIGILYDMKKDISNVKQFNNMNK